MIIGNSNQEAIRITNENARITNENARISGGALIKSGDSMTGDLNIPVGAGIKFGNMKLIWNPSIGIEIVTIP